MRNVFDQYASPENRLTHALAVSLDEDRRLLNRFLRWLRLAPPCSARSLIVVEQSLPGDSPDVELDAERRGLPDVVIHDGSTWCVLIESKVEAPLTLDQLIRHTRTLNRRGFRRIHSVVVTKAGRNVPPRLIARTWSELYEWAGKHGARREWPERLRDYLRVAETSLAQVGYLKEGTLTMFDGFPFSAKNPYTYGEAKRTLKLAMVELRKSPTLRAIGMDPSAKGRIAITGSSGTSVWDFLSLSDRPKRSAFTRYPHLTLSVHADHLDVAVTIPNGVVAGVRKRLASLGAEGLADLNGRILRRAQPIIKRGGWVHAYALQRHYRSQRSVASVDANMSFKLETSQPRASGLVKPQPAWASLMAELLRRRRGNVQFGYVVAMPWTTGGINSRQSLKLIADSWGALKPLLDVIRFQDETRG